MQFCINEKPLSGYVHAPALVLGGIKRTSLFRCVCAGHSIGAQSACRHWPAASPATPSVIVLGWVHRAGANSSEANRIAKRRHSHENMSNLVIFNLLGPKEMYMHTTAKKLSFYYIKSITDRLSREKLNGNSSENLLL